MVAGEQGMSLTAAEACVLEVLAEGIDQVVAVGKAVAAAVARPASSREQGMHHVAHAHPGSRKLYEHTACMGLRFEQETTTGSKCLF